MWYCWNEVSLPLMSCPEQSHGHGVSCQGLETAERLLGKHRCDFWLCV